MEQNVQHAINTGYLKGIESILIPLDDIDNYDRKRVVVISTGSQGEFRSGLFRVAANEHPRIKLTEGDLVIMSSKFIPGNEKAIGRMVNNLFKLGADVLYESVANIHVSGHANAEELRQMIRWTKPKFFIPVHGEYRHLVKHQRLALNEGIPRGNTRVAINGDILEMTSECIKIVDHREENRVLIEGEGGSDVSKVVLKDRRKVAETGIVFTVLIRDARSGEIVGGPDLFTRGFIEETVSESLINDSKEVLLNVVDEVERNSKSKNLNLQEEIRVQLRRFYQSRLGKKPVVVPIVIDI